MMKNKILLVEDQPIILKVVENRLRKEGFDVTTCDNGKDAQTCFDANHFDAVLTDLLMPQACGLELLNHIRNEKKSETPVVIFSEINIEEKAHEAMNIGANLYMRKPFDMNELIQSIKFFSINAA